MKKVLILGSAGFLGSHLEHRLKAEGNFVVSVARKFPTFRKTAADEFNILDLTNPAEFHSHFWRYPFDEVYQMAGEVGGLGYIGTGKHDYEILTDSLKINLYTLEAIRKFGSVGKIFFASSQCVYPNKFEVDPFAAERLPPTEFDGRYRECDSDFDNNFAFAKEKLYAEAIYQAYAINHGLDIRIGRYGNIYGAYCTWDGERAKSVAAICRKVAQAPYAGVVELWGSGDQKRSFTYVDDAIEGTIRLMQSTCQNPVNIAHPDLVTIDDLFETVCSVAGKALGSKHVPGIVGSPARGSHNGLCKQVLGWEPTTSLWEGLSKTYPWIREQAEKALTRDSA